MAEVRSDDPFIRKDNETPVLQEVTSIEDDDTESSEESVEETKNPFFVQPTITVKIYALLDRDNELISLSQTPLTESQQEIMKCTTTEITAKFSMPSSSEMENYRISSSVYNADARNLVLQKPILRRLLLVNHLKSVDIPGVQIEHDKRNRLTTESEEVLDTIHPSIVDMLILKFQDKASLII